MAQPSLDKPKTQLLGNGCETAKHHLNPSVGTAENTTHHLNPSLGTAKNSTFGGSKTAPGSFRQQTQRTRGDAKKTMLRNCLGYFKESMQSWKPPLPPRLLPHYSLVMGGVIRLNLVLRGVIRLNNNSIYLKPDDLVLLLAECTASATPHTCLLRGLWQNVCFPLGKWTFLWPHLRSSCGVVRSRDTMVYIWNRMISYYYWRNAAHPLLHSSVAFQAKPSSHAAAPTSDTLTDTLAHHHGPAFTPSHCFHFTMPHTILATLI